MTHLRIGLIVATILLIVACTAKLQQNSNSKSDNTKKEALAKKASTLPIDSLIKRREVEHGYTRLTFDTSKCKQYPPDFTRETIFTKPEYKALFGWTDDYSIETNPKPYHNPRLMYKNVPYNGSAFSCRVIKGYISWAKGLKFIPDHEPSEVRISLDEARKIALAQNYPTLGEEFPTDTQKIRAHLSDKSDENYARYLKRNADNNKKTYLPNAKFVWEKLKPITSDSIYYPKGELIYLPSMTIISHLLYRFDIYALSGLWVVYINPITGEMHSRIVDNRRLFTCEPSISSIVPKTTDYLWYYNNLTPMPTINVASCDFGSCEEYRYTDGHINAFCQEGFFDETENNIEPHKSFIDWSSDNEHRSPNISLNIATLPTTVNSTDGTVSINITPAMGVPTTTYSYSGSQVLITNGLVNTTISTTNSGTNIPNLSAGIYELTLTSGNGCNYTEYIAIGYQTGFNVTATIPQAADCYNNEGNIHLSVDNVSSFVPQAPQVIIKGAINTNAFMAVSDYTITSGKFEFDLRQLNVGGRPLPPGNYAILVRNPTNNKMTGINIRLDYPNCEVERKLLQTAYWAVKRTDQLFKGNSNAINDDVDIDITLPLGIVTPETTNPLPDDGFNQFTHSSKPIGIGIVHDGFADNASFVKASSLATESLIKIGSGTFDNPVVALDVLAHEYGHGINTFGMNVAKNDNTLISAEADAIDEGFSDIVAIIVESTIKPIDWVIADGLPITVTPRYLNNPMGHEKPSIYHGPNWSLDEERYTNSQVFSYWFYLLANGGSQTVNGTPYTVPALGIERAAKITLAAFVSEDFGLDEVSNKNYSGLCVATSKAANALYPPNGEGSCSPEVIAVHEAWQAVGVNCWETIVPALCASCLPTDPEDAICDNHLPYLRSIKVINGTTIISQQEWQDDGTERCLVNEISQQETDFSTPLHIEVTASEPLTNLVFKGFSFGNYLVGPNIDIPTTNNTNTYSFDIPIIANGVNIPHLAQLNFIGTDLSGNQLEALQTYPLSNQQNCLNLSDVPNHNTDGTWTPPPHNTENDKSFSLTTNHCNFDFTIGSSLFIGTLYCNPLTGTQYYSYSIKDNETNQWVIEDCLIVSNFGFVTAGILPHNYTLEVTNTSGCIKSITGTWEEPNGCVFRLPSNDPNAHVKIDNTYCYPIGDGNYQIAMVLSDDLEGINHITIDISGLIDQAVSLGQNNCCPTVTITIPEAVINYELPYTFTMTGTNACKYYGTVKCGDNITPPVGVSGTGYCETPTFDYATGTEPIAYINACSGQEICLPYHVYCSNTAAISIVTPVPYLVHQNTTSTNTGTFCFTPDDSYIGTHQIKLMAANLDCPYTWKLAERLFELNVTCCPTTFTTTTTTPAYIGCNGALLLGGTATLISDASCLTNYTIQNGLDHTAYNLSSGNNTVYITANGSTYTTTVNIPTITVDNNALQVTANTTQSAHSCSTDYCTGSITLDAKLQINATNTNTNNTYTWADCALCNTPTRTNLCAGSYTVTVTNTTSGCSKAITYIVLPTNEQSYASPYEQVMCCVANSNLTVKPTDTGIVYPDDLQPTRAAYLVTSNETWTATNNPFNTTSSLYFATDLVISANSTLQLHNINLHFAPNMRILVQGGGTLYVGNQTTIDGFCESMWQGVQVEGATTANNNTAGTAYFNNCTIQNAIVGIAGMNIPLMNVVDIVAINTILSNEYFSASSLALPYLWHPNSRNTAGGLIEATNSTFNNCLQGINISWCANQQNLFDNCTFNSNQIQFPFANLAQQTEVGIDGLYIKTLGSITNNHFNNLRYGIRLNEVNTCKITQNYFNDNKCGVSTRAWLLGLDNATYVTSNYFENNQIAIQANGMDNLLVRDNHINTTSNSQTTYPNGSAGIYARGCNSLLQNNTINKLRFGIILSDSDDDGSQIAGNIINQTQEAIVCEGDNGSCYFTCNHLLDYTKFGLDIRQAGAITGKLPPQGDCSLNEPAANTFIPFNATDIIMGGNTNNLYYDDVAANMLLVSYADGSLTGQFIAQTEGCNGVNLVDYCEGLRLTSLADIDVMPEGIKRNKEVTKQFLTALLNEDYESAMSIVHKYNNSIMLRKLVPHKINKDSILVAESLLQGLSTEKEEYLRYKQLYTLLIDIAQDNRTIFDLSSLEKELLTAIANSATKTAYKAQTLLYAIDGKEYAVLLPYLANGLPTNNWITVFKADQLGRISTIYPNPTNGIANINYQLVPTQTATISLFDITGRLLSTATVSNSGTYSFDTNIYPSGIYLCKIKVDGKLIKTEKLVVSH